MQARQAPVQEGILQERFNQIKAANQQAARDVEKAANMEREVSGARREAADIARLQSFSDPQARRAEFDSIIAREQAEGDPQAVQMMQRMRDAPSDIQNQFFQGALREAEVRYGIKAPRAGGLSDQSVPSDVRVFEYREGLTPERRASFDRSVRGESESEKQEARLQAELKRAQTPGTPEYRQEQEARVAKQKAERATRMSLFKLEDSLKLAQRIEKGVSGATTGLIQSVVKYVPGTKQFNQEASVEALLNRIALDSMLELKANSPTGSTGFGQLSNRELGVLQNSIANLSTSQDEAQFRENLKVVMANFKRAAGLIRLEYQDAKEEPAKTLKDRIAQLEKAGIDEDDIQRQVLSFEALAMPEAVAEEEAQDLSRLSDEELFQ